MFGGSRRKFDRRQAGGELESCRWRPMKVGIARHKHTAVTCVIICRLAEQVRESRGLFCTWSLGCTLNDQGQRETKQVSIPHCGSFAVSFIWFLCFTLQDGCLHVTAVNASLLINILQHQASLLLILRINNTEAACVISLQLSII